MDIGFEVLLPVESKISTINFEQPVFEWNGEKYPQGQEEAWVHYFKLIKSNVPEHVVPLLPDSFQKRQWQCVSIVDGIDDLQNDLSAGINIENENNTVFDLLSSLTEGERMWVIVFEPNYDCIDDVLEGNLDIALHKIIDSITIKRTGFVLWFDMNEQK